jgi:hypothetical protein
MKLGCLGFLGSAGWLGFWDAKLFALFYLYFLFLADAFPKRGKGPLKISLLFLLTAGLAAGNLLSFFPAIVISRVFLAWVFLFIFLIILYPTAENSIDDLALKILCDPYTHEPLTVDHSGKGESLVNRKTGALYPIKEESSGSNGHCKAFRLK